MSTWDEISADIKADVDAADAKLTQAQADLAAARAHDIIDEAEIADLTKAADEHAAKLADLQKLYDAKVAEDAAPAKAATTSFGSCPAKGGESLAAVQSVGTKWGAGTPVRVFSSDEPMVVITDPAVGEIHYSNKPSMASPYRPDLSRFRKGDYVDPLHEFDVKLNQGTAPGTLDAYIPWRNAFYDYVKSVRPDLKVALTVGITRFWNTKGQKSSEDMSRWKQIKADTLFVDFDGGRDLTRYPDYLGAPAAIAAFVKGTWAHWGVGELAHPRITADTSGTARAAWLTTTAAAIKAGGAVRCDLFDFNSTPNQELTLPAEIAAYKAVRAG